MMKLIALAVRALNDRLNPDDKALRIAWADGKAQSDEADRMRNALPRTPIRTHTLDDLADFYVSPDGWFCVTTGYSETILRLCHQDRVLFMEHLAILIKRAAGLKVSKDEELRLKSAMATRADTPAPFTTPTAKKKPTARKKT